MTAITIDPVRTTSTEVRRQVPLGRVVAVELRKMFDTRSGFWLMSSIVIVGLLTTVGTVALGPESDLTYYRFAAAVGFPMTVVLPMIAVLAITGEWSQRSGLTTFTLVPHRGRVITAKVVASVTVAVAAMVFAFAIGAVGNVVGTAIAGTERVWDVSPVEGLNIVLGSLLCLLTGTILGLLLRSSAAALVAYFLYAFLLPTVSGVLASNHEGFRDLRPWVDLNFAQSALFNGTLTGEQWANLGVAVAIWLALPALLGLRLALRSEVK